MTKSMQYLVFSLPVIVWLLTGLHLYTFAVPELDAWLTVAKLALALSIVLGIGFVVLYLVWYSTYQLTLWRSKRYALQQRKLGHGIAINKQKIKTFTTYLLVGVTMIFFAVTFMTVLIATNEFTEPIWISLTLMSTVGVTGLYFAWQEWSASFRPESKSTVTNPARK